MRTFAHTLAALAIAAPLGAVAANSERPAYKDADADGNGKVAVDEATEAGVPKHEAKREDIDSDGVLTEADWQFVDMNAEPPGGSESS